MIELFAKLQRYAPTSMSMVIQGETGTGKERVAQAIHETSPRRDKRFVAVNCAAVADTLLEAELFGHVRGAFHEPDRARDGLFVEADGGTLLFDEVGENGLRDADETAAGSSKTRGSALGTGPLPQGGRAHAVRHVSVDLRHAVNRGRFRGRTSIFRMAQVTVEILRCAGAWTTSRCSIEDLLQLSSDART